ncbi:PHP domain-containing protein [Thermogladius sp. 4427co]|uniref:PHP domain-containing protein n=1 Tax=Thermogladius sp. 4427co TaxID=3450718 RepID=UPI003F78DFA6
MRIVADLHIHSVYSDGRAPPSEIIAYAIARGLNAISITDHNTFQGSIRALELVRGGGYDIIIVPGVEVRTDRGDVLVYCDKPFDFPLSLPELIDRAHENNCLVAPAHPFDLLRLGVGEAVYTIRGWDAIEVWNASATKSANRKAIEAARALGLPGIANSDAHVPEQVGSAYTVIEAGDASIESVLDAIRKGKTSPHYGTHSLGATVKWVTWSVERRLRNLLGRRTGYKVEDSG